MTAATREHLLTADEVSEQIGLSKQWVYLAAKDGRLGHVRRGRFFRFRPADVDAFLRSSERPPVPAPPPAEAPKPTGRVIDTVTSRSYWRARDSGRLKVVHGPVPEPQRANALRAACVPPDQHDTTDTHVTRLVSGRGVYKLIDGSCFAVGWGKGGLNEQRVDIVRLPVEDILDET